VQVFCNAANVCSRVWAKNLQQLLEF